MGGIMLTVIAIIVYSGSYPVHSFHLSEAETLALVPRHESRFVGLDRRNSWFRHASPDANKELTVMYESAESIQRQIAIVSILGYTGKKEEAEFIIDEFRKRCGDLADGTRKEEKGDKYLLISMLRALGNMGRRKVMVARQFVTDLAKGTASIRMPTKTSAALVPIWAVEAYVFLGQADLEDTIVAARQRVPNGLKEYAEQHDYRASFREALKKEAELIWAFELKEMKRKAASLD